MDILLTNDDGIEAAGLQALQKAAAGLSGARVIVVAPWVEQSQCGHRVTTTTPLRVQQRGVDRYAVDGTPGDCVRVALFALGIKPALVLSGINHGGNMGQDLYISGTVAAVREATYHGIPAAAFSHYLVKNVGMDWARVSSWTEVLLGRVIAEPPARGHFYNINLPHLPPGELPMPEVRQAMPAMSPLNVSFEKVSTDSDSSVDGEYLYDAVYAQRPADAGSDVDVCFSGGISWSVVKL